MKTEIRISSGKKPKVATAIIRSDGDYVGEIFAAEAIPDGDRVRFYLSGVVVASVPLKLVVDWDRID